jgi:hypothetical protein
MRYLLDDCLQFELAARRVLLFVVVDLISAPRLWSSAFAAVKALSASDVRDDGLSVPVHGAPCQYCCDQAMRELGWIDPRYALQEPTSIVREKEVVVHPMTQA